MIQGFALAQREHGGRRGAALLLAVLLNLALMPCTMALEVVEDSHHAHDCCPPKPQLDSSECCDPDDVDWYPGSDRLAMKLGSSGIMYECDLETRKGGHSWEYFDHMAPKVVGFVAERLDQVRRQAV